jgi:hypothetical protein
MCRAASSGTSSLAQTTPWPVYLVPCYFSFSDKMRNVGSDDVTLPVEYCRAGSRSLTVLAAEADVHG